MPNQGKKENLKQRVLNRRQRENRSEERGGRSVGEWGLRHREYGHTP